MSSPVQDIHRMGSRQLLFITHGDSRRGTKNINRDVPFYSGSPSRRLVVSQGALGTRPDTSLVLADTGIQTRTSETSYLQDTIYVVIPADFLSPNGRRPPQSPLYMLGSLCMRRLLLEPIVN